MKRGVPPPLLLLPPFVLGPVIKEPLPSLPPNPKRRVCGLSLSLSLSLPGVSGNEEESGDMCARSPVEWEVKRSLTTPSQELLSATEGRLRLGKAGDWSVDADEEGGVGV